MALRRRRPSPAAPPESQQRPSVDRAVFADLTADLGPEHIAEVCRLFLHNAASEIDTVRRSLDAGDPGGATDAAHRLKSASGFIGATTLVALCAEVEAGSPPAGAGELLAGALRQTDGELHRLVRHVGGAR